MLAKLVDRDAGDVGIVVEDVCSKSPQLSGLPIDPFDVRDSCQGLKVSLENAMSRSCDEGMSSAFPFCSTSSIGPRILRVT